MRWQHIHAHTYLHRYVSLYIAVLAGVCLGVPSWSLGTSVAASLSQLALAMLQAWQGSPTSAKAVSVARLQACVSVAHSGQLLCQRQRQLQTHDSWNSFNVRPPHSHMEAVCVCVCVKQCVMESAEPLISGVFVESAGELGGVQELHARVVAFPVTEGVASVPVAS